MRKNAKWGAVAAAVLFICTATAQDAKRINTKVAEATVFMQGAELLHTAQARLEKGAGEITLEGLSPNIDQGSLRINIGGSVVVSSYEYSIDYLSAGRKSPVSLQWMLDSINVYRADQSRTSIEINVNNGLKGYLETGISKNVSGSEVGLGIDELKKTMDYYKSKSEEIQNASVALQKKQGVLQANINRLQNQYNQESGQGNKTSGVLKINLSAPAAGTFPVTVTYYTGAAGWTPYYEINIASTDKPIRIAAKSKVAQSTGLDWENVKLTLSTAVPSNGKVAPLFSAWMLRQQQPDLTRALAGKIAGVASQNAYSYAEAPVLDEVVVVAYGTDSRGYADDAKYEAPAEPIIVIDGRIASQWELDEIDPSLIKSVEMLKNTSATKLYGSSASGGAYVVTLKSSMDDFITEEAGALNVVYAIDLPYTIPGNGRARNIDLTTKETAAEYKYYCAPKLDPAVYLLAEIGDWQNLGLLSGTASITYAGTYIGETYIDASSTKEKLSLTLGADKRMAVTRELQREMSSTRTIGSDVQKVYAYKLTVRNNQPQAVKMVLKDQYPISTQKNIVAVLNVKETTPWTANKEDLGIITWEEELAPGETRTYQISYSVRHPQGMLLNL